MNPHREAGKAQLVFASLVYKLKISVTSFLFKALLQRALGRAPSCVSWQKLSAAERRVALRVLAAAVILDGRLVRTERRLLTEAYAAAGVEPGLSHVEKLRRAFVAGEVIPRGELRRVAI